MKKFLLLSALIVPVLVVLLRFGTVSPCGILREEVRQAAAREGGLGVLASAMPDGLLDGLIESQSGPLSPGRCLVLVVSGPPVRPPVARIQAPPPRPQISMPVEPQRSFAPVPGTPEAIAQARAQADYAVTECRDERLSGELKTYVASAECSNLRIIAAYRRAGYPYMDLIYSLTAKRRETSQAIDQGRLTEAQAQSVMAQFATALNDRQQQRAQAGR